jgi:hypothetical protein
MACGIRSDLTRATALICVALMARGDVGPTQQEEAARVQPQSQASSRLPPEQLDSLVAPIALYPDPLLAQVLVAVTYPLEIVKLQQWLAKHQGLKDKALADAVMKEGWDPSIQAMAALPDTVKQLADNIKWTSELGNAFLAQQSDVMDAVQRMRAKAKSTGNLKSNEQMKVETKVIENKNVVVIEQANPQVIYVPSYNPTVVYGAAPVYAYPPVYYPPAGYYAAGMAMSFGVGVMMGAFWSGGWGYNAGWGGNNNVYINNNNNFNRNSNFNSNSRTSVGSGNRATQWQHNPQHRGGAPYGDRATANRFGGTTRGDSLSSRQANARQTQMGQGDRNLGTNRGAANDRNLGANRGTSSDRNFGANRGSANDRNVGANRDFGSDRNSGGDRSGGDRIGNREISGGGGSRGGGSRDGGAFGGAGRSSGASARASSARGSSSFGGGGRGGGRRR